MSVCRAVRILFLLLLLRERIRAAGVRGGGLCRVFLPVTHLPHCKEDGKAAIPAGWMGGRRGTLQRNMWWLGEYYSQKSLPLCSEPRFFLFLSLLCLPHTGSYRQNTLQSRQDMAADECEHSQPHKWKWLICHSSFQGGISLLMEGMNSIQPGAWGIHFSLW